MSKDANMVQQIADAAELANLKAEVVRAELVRRRYGTTNRDWFYMLTMPIWLPAVILGSVFTVTYFAALVIYGVPYLLATQDTATAYTVLGIATIVISYLFKKFLMKDSGTYKGGTLPPSSGYSMT